MKKIVPNIFLQEAAEVLKSGQPVRLHIDGRSMYPFIRGGKDEVEVVPYDGVSALPLWCGAFYCWEGKYMIHRYIGMKEGKLQMMGDGNLVRIETVEPTAIYGILSKIYHPDGSVQDCSDKTWLNRGKWWYRLRSIRRFLIPLYNFVDKGVKGR